MEFFCETLDTEYKEKYTDINYYIHIEKVGIKEGKE